MKSSFVLWIYLLSLFFFFYSCGETEDEVPPKMRSPEIYIPINVTEYRIGGSAWVPLSKAYLTELRRLEVPPVFEWNEDIELLQKYRHALLLQEYGDDLQVLNIIEFEVNIKPKRTFANAISSEYITYLDRTIAYLQGLMFISPSEWTRLALESTKSELNRLIIYRYWLQKEAIALLPTLERNRLIKQFGDIPEVRTYTNLLRKQLRHEPLTAEESRVYLEVKEYLWPKQKED